jgi:hypothetical protein
VRLTRSRTARQVALKLDVGIFSVLVVIVCRRSCHGCRPAPPALSPTNVASGLEESS